MSGQISSVHILRGVASLLVVWAHLSAYWLFATGETSTLQDAWTSAIAEPLHVYQDGGFLGVVIFFLISGYIVTHASMAETRSTYTVKRLLRIFPALALALAVLWALMHLMPLLGAPFPTFAGGPPGRWVQALVLVDGFTPGPYILSVTWTLAVEMMFYALVLAAIGQQRAHPLATTGAMVAAWAGLCLASFALPSLDARTPEVEGRELVIYLGVLLVGRCLYLVHSRRAHALAAGGLAALVALLVGVFQEAHDPGFLLTPDGFTDTEPLLAYATALVVFLGMLWWAPQRAAQPFALLGDVSYSLYLLHMPVGFATLGILSTFDVPNSLATVVAVGASVLAAWAAYRLVERPGQALARVVLGRRGTRGNAAGQLASP